MTETIKEASTPAAAPDPTPAVEDLLRSLKTHTEGLSSREAQRRLAQYGPNQLQRRGDVQWPREPARQLTHPLALLLWDSDSAVRRTRANPPVGRGILGKFRPMAGALDGHAAGRASGQAGRGELSAGS